MGMYWACWGDGLAGSCTWMRPGVVGILGGRPRFLTPDFRMSDCMSESSSAELDIMLVDEASGQACGPVIGFPEMQSIGVTGLLKP